MSFLCCNTFKNQNCFVLQKVTSLDFSFCNKNPIYTCSSQTFYNDSKMINYPQKKTKKFSVLSYEECFFKKLIDWTKKSYKFLLGLVLLRAFI